MICFGVKLDEMFEPPWEEFNPDDDPDYGVNEWWTYGVHGFRHSKDTKDKDALQERFDFEKTIPKIPVKILNFVLFDHEYVVAIPETINPTEKVPVSQESIKTLLTFCKDHDLRIKGVLGWHNSEDEEDD